MKISYNWLREYLPVDLPAGEIAEILTSLGLEVGAVEYRESIRGGLHGVVAGKVLTCEKHPNADRLSLTTVDAGNGQEPLRIVCGAPNVAAGQTVWVAPPGTTLHPAKAEEPLVIGKVKVRGEMSEGMICAEDELGLGEDHSGIMVLPDGIAPGTSAREYYGVVTDTIIDIDLTPNRSDAICHLGVARDLAAWLAINGTPVAIRRPEIPEDISHTTDLPVEPEVKNSEACPRYCCATISGITVKESPQWLKERLLAIDVRPINNIVDITNYILHEMGQPMHAFDTDKIGGRRIIVQTLTEGTPFVALDGVERKLSQEDLMICDGQGNGMCIAGVYGGLGTGISEATANLTLESAHFHPRWVRRTAFRHDLRTESARTFEKSTDPNICRSALIRAVELILELAGGTVASPVFDVYPYPVAPAMVQVRWPMLRRLAGIDIPEEEVIRILTALEMGIENRDAEHVAVAVPTNKADVKREADVIEEILRIYGYDNIPLPGSLHMAIHPASKHQAANLREVIGDFLSAHGFLETMGLSIVDARQFLPGSLSIEEHERISIENTSNVHLDLMRHDILASAVETVRFNQNRNQQDLRLFEFGHTYRSHDEAINEEEHLALMLTGESMPSGWRGEKRESDFFTIKKYVHQILGKLGIGVGHTEDVGAPIWAYGLKYFSEEKPVVTFGKISHAVMREHDLRGVLFFADFPMKALLAGFGQTLLHVQEISRFPGVRRDIAIVAPGNVPYAKVYETVEQSGTELLTGCRLFDVYENAEQLGVGMRSLALALDFGHLQRTLTDTEVSDAVKRITDALSKHTGAVLRS